MIKLLKSFVLLAGSTFLCLSFLSCDNFLKATEIKEEIEKAIAYNNAKSYTIKVEAQKGSGSILKPLGGEISKKATDTFTVSFEPDPDYTFVRWEAYSDFLPEGQNIKDYVKIEDPQSLETKVTFLKEIESLVIYANCPRIPNTSVFIYADNGIISPSSNYYTVNMNEENYISFNPSREYAFIRWQVYDKKTDTPFQNGQYIQVEDPSALSTYYKLVNIPADQDIQLSVKPLVIDRAKVMVKSPEYNPAQGAYRDSRIIVMFNKTMDLESIYYTENETVKEITEIKEKYNLTDSDLLWVDIGKTGQSDKRCYGYVKKDGDIVFKNISIVNGKNSQENMLRYFEKPRFESAGRLSISPKKDENGKFVLPNPGTSFNVTLAKDFFYTYEGKAIELKEEEAWPYYVGYKQDETKPTISPTPVLEILNGKGDAISKSKSDPTYLNAQKKIKIRAWIEDNQSGPLSSFDLILEGKTVNGVSVNKTISLEYDFTEGPNAYCGNAYLSDITEGKTYSEYILDEIPDEDGDYKFNLRVYDNVGLYVDSDTYYISLDTTPIPVASISNREITAGDTSLQYAYNCSASDFKEVKIYYRKLADVTSENENVWPEAQSVSPANKNETVTIPSLSTGTAYELKVFFYDKAYNETTFYYKKNTLPELLSISNTILNEVGRNIILTLDKVPSKEYDVELCFTFEGEEYQMSLDRSSATNKSFLYANVDYAHDYSFYVVNKICEHITDDKYDNYNKTYTDKKESATTTFRSKPKGPDYNLTYIDGSSCSGVSLSFTNINLNPFTGLFYSYAKYDSDGNLGSFSTPIKYTYTTNGKLDIPLDACSHYLLKLETYYGDESNKCNPDDIVYEEIFTGVYGFQNYKETYEGWEDTVTKNTVDLYWNKPNATFNYYKLQWKRKNDSQLLGEAIVNKDVKHLLISCLPQDTEIAASITAYTDKFISRPTEITFTTLAGEAVEDFLIKNPYMIQNNDTGYLYFAFDNQPGLPSSIKAKYWSNGKYVTDNYNVDRPNVNNNRYIVKLPNILSFGVHPTLYVQFVDGTSKEPISDKYAIRYKYNSFADSFSYFSTDSKISLSWNKVITTRDFNKLQYKKTSESTWKDGDLLSQTQGEITGLDPNTEYDIRLLIPDTQDYYAVALAKTKPNPITSAPPVVDVDQRNDYVTMWWNSSSDAQYYNIYKKEGNNYILIRDNIASNSNNLIQFDLYGLQPQTDYNIVVASGKIGFPDNMSCEKSITTAKEKAKPVSNLKSVNATTTQLPLQWDSFEIDGRFPTFKISYKASTASDYIESTNSENSCNYTINDLSPGTKYDIKIVNNKFTANTTTESTACAQFYTLPNTCTFNESQIEKKPSGINLKWTNPTGNYYKVVLSYNNPNGFYPEYEIPVLSFNYNDADKPTSVELDNLTPAMYSFTLTTYADEAMTVKNSVNYRVEIEK